MNKGIKNTDNYFERVKQRANRTNYRYYFFDYLYYTGKHWAQRKKDAEELHELTVLSMKKAKIRKEPLPFAVELRFRFNDRLDCSDHAIIVKIVEDAMKGWIIKDDSRRYVKSITTEFYNGDSMEVLITKAKS